MIYPKLPRKSIALLLVCLIFTLAAVGVMFVIYFFHTRNTLLVDRGAHDNLHDSNAISYSHFLTASIDQHHAKGNAATPNAELRGAHHNMRKDRMHQHHLYHQQQQQQQEAQRQAHHRSTLHEHQTQRNAQEEAIPIEHPSMSAAASDTIYIDDYDKIKDKSLFDIDTSMAVNQIDYFDRIIADHATSGVGHKFQNGNKETAAAPSRTLTVGGEAYRNAAADTSSHKIFLSKQRQDKIKHLKTMVAGGDDNDDDDDEDLISSGSGDFSDGSVPVAPAPVAAVSYTRMYRLVGKRPLITGYRASYNPREHLHKGLDGSEEASSSSEINTSEVGDDEMPFYHSLRSEFSANGVTTSSISISSSEQQQQQQQQHKSGGHRLVVLPPSGSYGEQLINQPNQRKISSSAEHIYHNPSETQFDSAVVGSRKRSSHNASWLETRARRILGNTKKSEERSRRLLLCEQDVSSELCRMLFKAYLSN